MFRFILYYLSKRVYCTIVVALLFVIFYAINTKRDILMDTNFIEILRTDKGFKIGKSLKANRHSDETNIGTFSERIQDMKYILVWTNPRNTPLVYLGDGQTVFLNKSCAWNNCHVTSNRNLLGDYTEFEAVLFNGPELYQIRYMNDLPKRRYQHQKYIYANIESAANYPICSEFWNNFFNWTWSYKTDSDLYWPYFSIRDSMKKFIGPKKDMNWIETQDMDMIDEKLKVSLSSKRKAAAWFASNCETQSLREHFVEELRENMKLYGLELDIFGECGGVLQCPRNIMSRCHSMLEKQYYFYLAFENSISDDYVSEKILHALLHNTVPVVLGGANYSRFLPKGSYLNALELGAMKLARKMNELIQNPKAYNDFFRWKKYYSYHYTHESPETDVYCRLCEYLNNDKLMNKQSAYQHFNHWWTPQRHCSDVINVKIG